ANVTGLQEIDILGDASFDTPAWASGEFILEWRAYLGANTLVAEGQVKFEEEVAGTAGRLRRPKICLDNKPGFIVGRILYIVGKRPESYEHDPSFVRRLRHYEERHPEIAKAYPDIGIWAQMPVLHKVPAPGPMIIFIHGTFSCTLPNLELLHPLRVPSFRFE